MVTKPTTSQITHKGGDLYVYLEDLDKRQGSGGYVFPWQFGAIADGKYHPLSERYSTLDDAKEVYPFVTALTQSIDWAACQAADLYSRGKYIVKCIQGQGYHFGDSDYLELGINSKWEGSRNVNRDTVSVVMQRNKPTVKPAFGRDCVVRVADATAVGAPDEFVRGIVFDGFVLTRGVARRSACKADQTICFHANYGLGLQLGVVVFGAEYGVFGYSFWGSSGWIKADSCHKGFMADATALTPEHPIAPAGSVNTTFHFDVRIDACPFGLVLKRVKYSSFSGYIEGIAVGTSSVPMPIYDSANETAIAVTAIYCDSVDIEQLGIEYWEGVILYNLDSTISINMSLTQDKKIKSTTGKQSAWKTLADLMGTADPYPLPSTANSMFYALGKGSTVIRNMTGDLSSVSDWAGIFFITKSVDSSIVFENCSVYFGSNNTIFCNGSLARVDTVGGRYIEDAITPNGFVKVGKNLFAKSSWSTKAINAGDGKVQISVGSDLPPGLKIYNVDAYPIVSTNTQPIGISQVSANDTVIAFQTSVNTAGYSINWKAIVSWV